MEIIVQHIMSSKQMLDFCNYYSPDLERFVSLDPLGHITYSNFSLPLREGVRGRGPFDSEMNLYAYVNNNPINKDDPFGLREDWETLQPEGWRPYSSETWNMSKPGLNTPGYYQYVEGVMVAGPAVALAGVGVVASVPIVIPIVEKIGSEILYRYLQNPQLYNQIAKGAISGVLAEGFGQKSTVTAPGPNDVVSFYTATSIKFESLIYQYTKTILTKDDTYIKNNNYDTDVDDVIHPKK